jgi:hypothetical protein
MVQIIGSLQICTVQAAVAFGQQGGTGWPIIQGLQGFTWLQQVLQLVSKRLLIIINKNKPMLLPIPYFSFYLSCLQVE